MPIMPIISCTMHERIPTIFFWWWATSYWRAASLSNITSPPTTSMVRKWWQKRHRGWQWPPFKSFPFIREAISSTISIIPVQWGWSIKLVSPPVSIFYEIHTLSAQMGIWKLAFMPEWRQSSRPILSRAIPCQPTRRRSIAIQSPFRGAINWRSRKASRRSMKWWRCRISPPRTSSRCITRPITAVTMVPPSKVKIITPAR